MIKNGKWDDVEKARTITRGICVRPYSQKVPNDSTRAAYLRFFQEYELPEMIEEWVWSSVENVEKSEMDNFYVQMASSG